MQKERGREKDRDIILFFWQKKRITCLAKEESVCAGKVKLKYI